MSVPLTYFNQLLELVDRRPGLHESARKLGHVEVSYKFDRRLLCMSMLSSLGAPTLGSRPLVVVEDEVWWLLMHSRSRAFETEMLRSTFVLTRRAETVAILKAHCKLSEAAVNVMCHLRAVLRPLHIAVLHSWASVIRMLIGAARRSCTDADVVQGLTKVGDRDAISPLCLAVLFAEKDVVDVLKRNGAVLNGFDAQVIVRLQDAQLGPELEDRFRQLGLEAEAVQLKSEAEDVRRRAAEAGEAWRPQATTQNDGGA